MSPDAMPSADNDARLQELSAVHDFLEDRKKELSAIQDFLENRKKELSAKCSEKEEAFQTAVDNSLKDFPRRARKRLVDFMGQIGYVVLDAHGSSDNAAAKRKKDWQDTIASIISKSPEAMLPAMSSLFDGFCKKGPCEITTPDAETRNRVKNLLSELGKQMIISSFTPRDKDTGFQVEFDESVLNPPKKDEEAKKKNVWLRSGWAERAFLYLVEKTVRDFSSEKKLPHDFYWNVTVSDREPYSQICTEFDILAYVGDRWYVFESKAGERLSVVRWVDRWRLFGEDKPDRKATFIQCAIQDVKPRIFEPLLLFPIHSFKEMLRAQLEKDFP